MTDMEILRSPAAIVGHRQINGECGGATVACVVLADGFIVECGSDGYSEKRAIRLAAAINAGDSAVFDFRRGAK
jgi:hypothetical protein